MITDEVTLRNMNFGELIGEFSSRSDLTLNEQILLDAFSHLGNLYEDAMEHVRSCGDYCKTCGNAYDSCSSCDEYEVVFPVRKRT